MNSDNNPPEIPGYQILKPMGHGGMAAVYLAVQESFGRQVALKIMSDQLGQDDVWSQRFMHEARVVAQLSHTNIVPVFDVGNHDGRYYISMELLKGGKLDDKMIQGLNTTDIVRIVSGIAAGLQYAGEKGFVHRDIKPDNIMFREDGTPVILDFGIAKQTTGDSKLTQTGTIVGTTGYMSPEQAMGEDLDPRSDIYSLGILLYELLTGNVPFRDGSAVQILLKHVQEAPPPLPSQQERFQPILDRMLAKAPQDRYENGGQLIADLQALDTRPQEAVELAATQAMPGIGQSVAAPQPQQNKTKSYAAAAIAILVLAAGAGWLSLRQPAVDQQTAETPEVPEHRLSDTGTTVSSSNPQPTQTETVEPVATEKMQAPVVVEETSNAPLAVPPPAQTESKQIKTAKSNAVNEGLQKIINSAESCLQRLEYDCAKSKAESVLALDPGNKQASQIYQSAEKAQQEAFAGDWNAQ